MGGGSVLDTGGHRTEANEWSDLANEWNALFQETRYVCERVLTKLSGPMYLVADMWPSGTSEENRKRRPGTHRRRGRHRQD